MSVIKKLEQTVPINIVNILYLDDEQGDLDSFKRQVDQYNITELIDDNYEVCIVPAKDFDQLMTLIENETKHTKNNKGFDVIICDQNLPGNWNGLKLIKYLQTRMPSPLFVLYTGAANPLGDVKNDCKACNILFIEKTEEFSTIIEKIFGRLSKNTKAKNNPDDPLYINVSNEIIEDMQKIEKRDSTYRVVISNKRYTPSELILHIKHRTDVGDQFIEDYVEGLKFIKKMNNAPKI